MEIFGLSVSEIVTLATIALTGLWAWFNTKNTVKENVEDIKEIKHWMVKREEYGVQVLREIDEKINLKITPLETKVNLHDSNYASLHATLTSMNNHITNQHSLLHNQLQLLNSRLDTVINNLIERNK